MLIDIGHDLGDLLVRPENVGLVDDHHDLLAPLANPLQKFAFTLGEGSIRRGHEDHQIGSRNEVGRNRLVSAVIHLRLIPKLKSFYVFNVAALLGFSSVIMTYFGVNFYPLPNVVFKADVQLQNDEAGNTDGFNLGMGYQF